MNFKKRRASSLPVARLVFHYNTLILPSHPMHRRFCLLSDINQFTMSLEKTSRITSSRGCGKGVYAWIVNSCIISKFLDILRIRQWNRKNRRALTITLGAIVSSSNSVNFFMFLGSNYIFYDTLVSRLVYNTLTLYCHFCIIEML